MGKELGAEGCEGHVNSCENCRCVEDESVQCSVNGTRLASLIWVEFYLRKSVIYLAC